MSPETRILNSKKDQPTLEEAQAFVGGYIEIVTTRKGEQIVINEEGKLQGLPWNDLATDLAHEGGAISSDDYIAGNCMILVGKARLD